MNCPRCHGKGREILQTQFGQGRATPVTLPEIAICPDCQGTGQAYCCDGAGENYSGEQRVTIMVEIAEELLSEVNPNDAGQPLDGAGAPDEKEKLRLAAAQNAFSALFSRRLSLVPARAERRRKRREKAMRAEKVHEVHPRFVDARRVAFDLVDGH